MDPRTLSKKITVFEDADKSGGKPLNTLSCNVATE